MPAKTSHYSKPTGDLLADFDEETEARLLSCLTHPKISRRDVGLLPPASDLSNETYRTVYGVMVALLEKDGRIDPSLVFKNIREKGLELGNDYFRAIRELNAHPEYVREYGSIVHGLAVRRRVKEAGILLAEKASRHTGEPDELLSLMQTMVQTAYRETSIGSTSGELVSFQDALGLAWDKIVNPDMEKWIPTGIPVLDEATGGLREGELMVVGADSGDGKTSLAMQFILHSAALSGKRWLMVSKEMTPEQLARRQLLMRANVNNLEIRRAQMQGMALPAETWNRLKMARAELEQLRSADGTPHIMIVPPGHISAQAVCSMIRREKMARGLDAFVVDYLQILDKPIGARLTDSEEEKIRMDCQGFKDIAMEERLSGVILSQFVKRGAANRAKDGIKPRPTMDDLKGSQGVQAAADVILLLHRPQPADEFNSGLAYPVDCIIAKGRNVGTGDVHLDFEPQFTRFTDRAAPTTSEGETKW